MTRSEMINLVAVSFPKLTTEQVESIITLIFSEISGALAQEDRVELRGFGSFSIRQRKPRIGRNPRTGAVVPIPAKGVPFFKTGKDLRLLMNS